MFRVGIIGAESTGKSTLAKYLAKRYNGILIPEYAREFVEQKGTTEVTWEELCEIARHQIRLEEARERATGVRKTVVFYDTELIVTKVWFEYAFHRVPEWLEEAIKRFPMDVYLLTYPDLPWVPDKARSNGSDAIRMELTERYEAEIEALGIPYYIIEHTN